MLLFSLLLLWEVRFESRDHSSCAVPHSPPSSMVLRVVMQPISPWQWLGSRAWAAPPYPVGPEIDTLYGCFCHSKLNQCCVNCQGRELGKDSITVCPGVSPGLGLNSFPCFPELITFSSTIASPAIHTRTYHQDLPL